MSKPLSEVTYGMIKWILIICLFGVLLHLAFLLGEGQGQMDCRLECCQCRGIDAGLYNPNPPVRPRESPIPGL